MCSLIFFGLNYKNIETREISLSISFVYLGGTAQTIASDLTVCNYAFLSQPTPSN